MDLTFDFSPFIHLHGNCILSSLAIDIDWAFSHDLV
jgi:hypothetical protein